MSNIRTFTTAAAVVLAFASLSANAGIGTSPGPVDAQGIGTSPAETQGIGTSPAPVGTLGIGTSPGTEPNAGTCTFEVDFGYFKLCM